MKKGTKHIITLLIILTTPIWLIIGLFVKLYVLAYKQLWDKDLFEIYKD